MATTTYIVTGSWPFPKELMRRDRSSPATLADRAALFAIAASDISEVDKSRVFIIALVSRRPRKLLEENADSWQSKGWHSSLCGFQHNWPTPLALPSTAAPDEQLAKGLRNASEDSIVAELIDLSMRYIDACALLGHMAGLLQNKADRTVVDEVIEACAKSFSGVVEFVANDDGGWSSRWCNMKCSKGFDRNNRGVKPFIVELDRLQVAADFQGNSYGTAELLHARH